MTARFVETRSGDPAETRVDLSLPDLGFGGIPPEAPDDDDAYLDALAAQLPGVTIEAISIKLFMAGRQIVSSGTAFGRQ